MSISLPKSVGQGFSSKGEEDHEYKEEKSPQYPAIIFGTFDQEILSSKKASFKRKTFKGNVKRQNDEEGNAQDNATTTNPSLITTIIKIQNCFEESINVTLKSNKERSAAQIFCIYENKPLASENSYKYYILHNVEFNLTISSNDSAADDIEIPIKANEDQTIPVDIDEPGCCSIS